uniref:Lipoprotein n=1 Tax=Acidobacterium capsulatum TaxID=33075 RepID=A0A7V4XTK2_9BACT
MRVFSQPLRCLLLLLCLLGCGTLAAHADPVLEHGYGQMYNVNFAGAHQTFDAYIQAHPDDPMGPVSDAAAYLFAELDRLGILDLRLFADNSRFSHRKRPTPNPAVQQKFQARIDEAKRLAAAALSKNPKDVSALLASTLADGLQSDYAALILKHDLDALRFSNRATVLAQKTLAVDPHCYDAYLAVGIENYLLGIKPAPVRWVLSWTGAQTNASAGVRELRLAAAHGHYLAPFARLLLAVADIRQKNYAGARDLLLGLSQEFPANPLYRREYQRIAHK